MVMERRLLRTNMPKLSKLLALLAILLTVLVIRGPLTPNSPSKTNLKTLSKTTHTSEFEPYSKTTVDMEVGEPKTTTTRPKTSLDTETDQPTMSDKTTREYDQSKMGLKTPSKTSEDDENNDQYSMITSQDSEFDQSKTSLETPSMTISQNDDNNNQFSEITSLDDSEFDQSQTSLKTSSKTSQNDDNNINQFSKITSLDDGEYDQSMTTSNNPSFDSEIDKSKTSKKSSQVPLYVFGDSLYDTGMALYCYKGPAADSYPYGSTYFKRPAGRFSDGRLIPDFIAEFAKLPFPEPYANPKLTNYTLSVNFADASAGVLVETRPNTLNLKLQMEYFHEMIQKMEQKLGQIETKQLLANAVYLINIGANDYVDFYYFNPAPIPTSVKDKFLSKIIGNFTTHITTIYNKGGRKFAFQNFAPVGCFPTFLKADGSCTKELNDLAKMHNVGFLAMLQRLTRQLPGFTYSLYDFYTALSIRLTHGYRFGFKEYKAACCGSGPFNGKFTCMDKANFTVCDNPKEYLWFDAGHPTQSADQQFAQEFWSGPPNIVAPRNLKSLFEKSYIIDDSSESTKKF